MSLDKQSSRPLMEGQSPGRATHSATSGDINQIIPQPVSTPHGVPLDKLPRHIAVICDGNARWAQARGLSIAEGHDQGAALLMPIAQAAADWGIAAVTAFTLSIENFKREEAEVDYLFALLSKRFYQDLPQLIRLGVKIRAMSHQHLLPSSVQQLLATLEAATAHNNRLLLTVAVAYGGQQDIILATQQLARKVQQGLLQPDQITEALMAQHLSSAAVGAPDLLIRTSGEQRLSNFMLWESAYTELYFTNKMWPDFGRDELEKALQQYASRERRFGARGFSCDGNSGRSSPTCTVLASEGNKAESVQLQHTAHLRPAGKLSAVTGS